MTYERPLLGQDITVYIAKQTDIDQIAYPTGANAILAQEISGFVFKARTVMEPERAKTFDLLSVLQAGFEAGEGNISALVKPGTAGTIHGDQLLEALFGLRSYDSGTKQVTYSQYGPSDPVTYWTIAIEIGKVGIWLWNCRCTRGEFRFDAESNIESYFGVNTSWVALARAFAASDSLAQPLDNSGGTSTQYFTDITVNNARKFEENARIKIGTDDNSGQGYKIVAIDYSTNTLTLENPGIGVPAGQTIAANTPVDPFLPTPTIPSGTPIWTGFGWVKEDASAIPILNATVSYDIPLEVSREKANTSYPTRISESDIRVVEAKVELFFGVDQAAYFRDALDNKEWNLEFEAGDTSSSPWAKLSIPRAVTTEIDHTTDIGALRMNRTFRGRANAGSDVINLVVQTQ